MDSFELNKIAGAVLFALLIFFGTRTLTDIIFAAPKPEKPGMVVEVPDQAGGGAHGAKEESKPEMSIAQALSAADAARGQKQLKKCSACHSFDQGGANKIGPNLYGVVGRALGATDGFAYSPALKDKGGSWGYEELSAFLANPKGFIPGTKMAFSGLKSVETRADLILHLRSLGGNPPPLPGQ
jgi:cytochrome c